MHPQCSHQSKGNMQPWDAANAQHRTAQHSTAQHSIQHTLLFEVQRNAARLHHLVLLLRLFQTLDFQTP